MAVYFSYSQDHQYGHALNTAQVGNHGDVGNTAKVSNHSDVRNEGQVSNHGNICNRCAECKGGGASTSLGEGRRW